MTGLCIQQCVVPLGTDGSDLVSARHGTVFLQTGSAQRLPAGLSARHAFTGHSLDTCDPRLGAHGTRSIIPQDFTYETQIKR